MMETTMISTELMDIGDQAFGAYGMLAPTPEYPGSEPVEILSRKDGRAGHYEYRVRKLANDVQRAEVEREMAAKGIIMEDYNALADAIAFARRNGDGKLALRLLGCIEKFIGMDLAAKIDNITGVRSPWMRGSN